MINACRYATLIMACAQLACGGASEPRQPPGPEAVTATVSTTGPGDDHTGYAITLDNGPRSFIGTSGDITFDSVPPGPHVVRLLDVMSGCGLVGDTTSLRDIQVGEAGPVHVPFSLHCEPYNPLAGNLTVEPPWMVAAGGTIRLVLRMTPPADAPLYDVTFYFTAPGPDPIVVPLDSRIPVLLTLDLQVPALPLAGTSQVRALVRAGFRELEYAGSFTLGDVTPPGIAGCGEGCWAGFAAGGTDPLPYDLLAVDNSALVLVGFRTAGAYVVDSTYPVDSQREYSRRITLAPPTAALPGDSLVVLVRARDLYGLVTERRVHGWRVVVPGSLHSPATAAPVAAVRHEPNPPGSWVVTHRIVPQPGATAGPAAGLSP